MAKVHLVLERVSRESKETGRTLDVAIRESEGRERKLELALERVSREGEERERALKVALERVSREGDERARKLEDALDRATRESEERERKFRETLDDLVRVLAERPPRPSAPPPDTNSKESSHNPEQSLAKPPTTPTMPPEPSGSISNFRCPKCPPQSNQIELEYSEQSFCHQCNQPLARCESCKWICRPIDRHCSNCGVELRHFPLQLISGEESNLQMNYMQCRCEDCAALSHVLSSFCTRCGGQRLWKLPTTEQIQQPVEQTLQLAKNETLVLIISIIKAKDQQSFGDYAIEFHERIKAVCGDILGFDSILDLQNSSLNSLQRDIASFRKGKSYENAVFFICAHGKLLLLGGEQLPKEGTGREVSIVLNDGKILRVSEIERIVLKTFPEVTSMVAILDVCLVYHSEPGKCSHRYGEKLDKQVYPKGKLLNIKRMYITPCEPGESSTGTDSLGGIRLLLDVFHLSFIKDKRIDVMESFRFATSIFGIQEQENKRGDEKDNRETLCVYDERFTLNFRPPFNVIFE